MPAQVLYAAVEAAKQHFGTRLHSAYTLGSLAHGGFSPLLSDIDMALVLNDPIKKNDTQIIKTIQAEVLKTKLELAERLSIFWSTIELLKTGKPGGRFPLHDRLDLISHGKLLLGENIVNDIPIPSKKALIIDSLQFALDYLYLENIVHQIKTPAALLENEPKYISKIVLFPPRLIYTALTGKIATNEDAISDYCLKITGEKSDLVKIAYAWRVESANKQDIKPYLKYLSLLYQDFFDLYANHMQDYGEFQYLKRLKKWRNDLKLADSERIPQ